MTSELFFYGLKITAIGMGIVFVVLYIMQSLVKGIGHLVSVLAKDSKIARFVDREPVIAAEQVNKNIVEPASSRHELSLGVVLAISAALANAKESRFSNIVSIRKDTSSGSAWQQAGLLGNTEYQYNWGGADFNAEKISSCR